MKTLELLEELEHMHPTNEQLRLFMELREKIFPLPLYVKLPNGNHLLTRKLKKDMKIEGIATERGIYLTASIHPIFFANADTCIADLYAAAAKVYPDARPLIEDDIFGCEKNTLSSLVDTDSAFSIVLHELNRATERLDQKIEFLNYEHQCYAIPKAALPSDKYISLYSAFGKSEGCMSAIKEAYKIGLFIPAEKIVTTSFKENFADQISELYTKDSLLVRPPEPKEERFPLYLYLRNAEGKYITSNELPVPEGCKVEGVVMKNKIFLRQTIEPCKINKEHPNIADLVNLAATVHPQAKPLFFGGNSEHELLMILFLLGEQYRQTAKLLKTYGVEMPSLDRDIAYIAGGEGYLSSSANPEKIDVFSKSNHSGNRIFIPIKQIKEMFVVIPRK